MEAHGPQPEMRDALTKAKADHEAEVTKALGDISALEAAGNEVRICVEEKQEVTSGALGALMAAGLAVFVVLPQVADSGLEQQLVASHVRSLLANHLTDVATSDQHVIRPWLNGKVDVAPPVPELAPEGFPLVGGRLDYIDGHVAPAIVYRRRAHTVNLFVWPASRPLFERAKTVRRDGYTVEEWTAGGLRYAAVSDIDPGDLKAFKAAFEAHSPDPSH